MPHIVTTDSIQNVTPMRVLVLESPKTGHSRAIRRDGYHIRRGMYKRHCKRLAIIEAVLKLYPRRAPGMTARGIKFCFEQEILEVVQ